MQFFSSDLKCAFLSLAGQLVLATLKDSHATICLINRKKLISFCYTWASITRCDECSTKSSFQIKPIILNQQSTELCVHSMVTGGKEKLEKTKIWKWEGKSIFSIACLMLSAAHCKMDCSSSCSRYQDMPWANFQLDRKVWIMAKKRTTEFNKGKWTIFSHEHSKRTNKHQAYNLTGFGHHCTTFLSII